MTNTDHNKRDQHNRPMCNGKDEIVLSHIKGVTWYSNIQCTKQI